MGGGLVGSPPLEKKSDFLIFSAQNALFQLKWQKNLEYIFICFDIPLLGAEWGVRTPAPPPPGSPNPPPRILRL